MCPKSILGKGKNPKDRDNGHNHFKKIYQYSNGERIETTSSSLISDNFLLFILFLIFLHSVEHGSHVIPICEPPSLEELFLSK